MWYVAQVLADVPAVPERIVELRVQVTPEGLVQGLANASPGRDRSGEDLLRVVDVKRQYDRSAADRRRCEHTQLGEFVGQMQEAVPDPQPNRHQSPVGRGDPAQLLGAEGVAVEGTGPLRALNDDMRSDHHGRTVETWPQVVLDVLAFASLARVAAEQVRMWRSSEDSRILLMAGQTTSYAVEPRGEYVFGVVAGKPMRARRGRERFLVEPGELVAWDPSERHDGRAVDGQPWSARLMIVEVADLADLARDRESALPANILFPNPVIRDPVLAGAFLQMHVALETTATRLERDERLTTWLHAVIERFSTTRLGHVPLGGRADKALRSALEYLADRPERDVGLDELAAAAGIGKFRLVRLVRERTGLPPHALQLAHRIHAARRLLEDGQTIAATAAATGFTDQSHLHRHFQRTLGLTPGTYQHASNARRCA
jgi:AraC-like DNA-binding protein